MTDVSAGASSVVRSARAKINLSLRVVGKRPAGAAFAGYHELDSLVAFADLGDRIEARPARDLTLAVEGPFAAALGATAPEDNLVLRAARALQAKYGATQGAALTLCKALPVASGIGGGSADAAATLLALAELWRLPDEPAALAALGLTLGADLPVCLGGRAALVGGIGEKLRPAPQLPRGLWLALVNPGVALSTAAVFAKLGGRFSTPHDWPQGFENVEALADTIARVGNDLEAPARAIAPVVGEVLEELSAAEGAQVARMSGSGATCFALFASEGEARAAAAAIARRNPDWWVRTAALFC